LPTVVSQHLGENTHFLAILSIAKIRTLGGNANATEDRARLDQAPLSDSTGRLCSRVRAMSIGWAVLRNRFPELHPADFQHWRCLQPVG
jgi:hypothetical protein